MTAETTGDGRSTLDQVTADAFADSWNNLPAGSVYTSEQFEDWLAPLTPADVAGKQVLELGCGNGSLLVHMATWGPALLQGVDLGSSVVTATRNLAATRHGNFKIVQGDLTRFESTGFDLVYCIGVLHHLKDPKRGLDAVVRNTRAGGRFHCWVYGREGNGIVVWLVDPIRRLACQLPWWVNKYLVATPLAVPFYLYAKVLSALPNAGPVRQLPLYDYCRWIAKRGFAFFRHVAFDQLVTPQTVYVPRATVEDWLRSYPDIEPGSEYVIMRNGNSWKFGARRRCGS